MADAEFFYPGRQTVMTSFTKAPVIGLLDTMTPRLYAFELLKHHSIRGITDYPDIRVNV
jgi:hypothetical protein